MLQNICSSMDPPTRCRMCLTQCANDALKSMLSVSNDSINLWTMYDFVINVGENIDHAYIPYSCIICKKDLKSAYEFKLMCVETEKKLSELLTNDQSIEHEPKTEYIACNDDDYLDYSIEENEKKFKADSIDERSIENVSCNNSDSDVHVAEKCEEAESSENSYIEVCGSKHKAISNKSTNAKTKQVKTRNKMANQNTKSGLIIPKCKRCNIQFDQMKDYRAHYDKLHRRTYKRIIHKDNPRSCHTCNIKFENTLLYQAHYRQHHQRPVQVDKDDPARKVICTICGKLFGKRTIALHIQKMHSNEPKQEHICTTCGKRFKWIANLKLHERIHADNKRYECKICGEKFLHWSVRHSHIITKHTGEKKYECHICRRKFTQSGNLNTHILRHQNELPHKCSKCTKGFISTEELLKHEIRHLKDQNLLCEICEKCFRTRRTLRNHMKTHSGERNHLCLGCNKRFATAHSLRRHSKKHTGVEVPH